MNKRWSGLLLTVVLLSASLFFACGASALESTCPTDPIVVASVVPGEAEVTVYSDTNRTAS